MPKFKAEVSYEVTEVYEIEAKDADIARMLAEKMNRAPSERRTTAPRVEMVTQVSPRYVATQLALNEHVVKDTKTGEVLANVRYEDVAVTLVGALNAEEDM